MNRRLVTVCSAAALGLVAVGSMLLGVASARTHSRARFNSRLVRIISPEPGSPAFESGTRVVLKVTPGTHVRIRFGRRDVTRRFHPIGHGLLAGTVRLRDVGRGPMPLHVDSRRGSVHDKDFLLLIAAHQDPHFLAVHLHRTGPGAAPIDLSIHTAATRVFLRVRLNGHRLERVMIPRRVGDRTLRLTALHGLRYGRNTLTVVAHDGRGTGDQVTKVFTIRRTGPMPAASYRTIVHVSGTEVLDAGVSRAAQGGRLVYRWRVLAKPRGSRVRLLGRSARKARFRVDRPGRYRLRLTVIELPRRSAHRGVAEDVRAGRRSQYDLTVAAQAPVPPYGEPLVTVNPDPHGPVGIVVGGQVYPPNTQTFGSIQVLVIDRTTGDVVNDEIPGVGQQRDIATLASDMSQGSGPFLNIGPGQMVVIVAGWWYPAKGLSSTIVSELQNDLRQYGVDDPVGDAAALINGAPFAMVAVPGMDQGQAVVNPDGIQAGQIPLTTEGASLDGVLRDGPDGRLRFEQIDLVPYNTNQPTQPANIGPYTSQMYSTGIGSTVATPQGDVSLTVLDAHTLAPLSSVTISPGSAPSPGPLAPLLSALNNYVPQPCAVNPTNGGGYVVNCASTPNPNNAVLFVFRVNGYQPNSGPQDTMTLHAVVQDLAEVGVNRDTLVRSLAFPFAAPAQPGSDYVFIGGPGVHGVEGSALKTITNANGQQVSVSSPSIRGFLVRDEHGRFTPAGGTDAAGFDPTLQKMATTPPVAFGYPGTDVTAYQAAEDHLFQQYFAAGVLSGFPAGFRINYGNTAFTDELPTILAVLHCQTTVGQPPAPLNGEYQPTSQYTFTELNQMRRMLCDEMLRQETVDDHLFGPLRQIFNNEKVDGALDLLGANSTLTGYVQQSDPVPGVDPLEVAGAMATLLSGLAEDLIPEVGEEIAPVLSLAGDTMTVAAGFSRQDTTSIEYNHMVGEINVEAGQLANWVENRFNDAEDAVNEIEAVVLSNPVSLVTAYHRSIGANGAWNLGTANNLILQRTGPITFASQLSSLNYMYPHLVAAAAKPSCSKDQAWNTTPAGAMKYRAAIDGGVAFQNGKTILEPYTAAISSLGFSSSAASSLDSILFSDGGQGYVQGNPPTAASIVRSDFFMLEIAPNNTTCSESNTDPFCCGAADLPGPVSPGGAADRPRRPSAAKSFRARRAGGSRR